jgi:thiamine biosynthesis lipoprotein
MQTRIARLSVTRFALPVVAALVVAGCRGTGDELVTHRLFAMATWVDVSLPEDATRREPGLIRQIEAELRAFERDYYAWGDGELSQLNRALTETGEFEASEALAALLLRSQQIAAVTGGAFDPGVGALVERWGFATGEPAAEPPPDRAITVLLDSAGSIAEIRIAGTRISGGGKRYTLDLGGIAKGAAVDRIIEILRTHDAVPALVNAGGDLGVLGQRADRNWRIGIQAPRGDGVLGAIELYAGEAAFTSGDYERYFERDGERLHHILDPRTGYPASHTRAITVIATDGTTADAAATALFVAGPDEWRTMADALGLAAVLRVDADGGIEMTDAMRDRFQPSSEVSSDIIAAAD